MQVRGDDEMVVVLYGVDIKGYWRAFNQLRGMLLNIIGRVFHGLLRVQPTPPGWTSAEMAMANNGNLRLSRICRTLVLEQWQYMGAPCGILPMYSRCVEWDGQVFTHNMAIKDT